VYQAVLVVVAVIGTALWKSIEQTVTNKVFVAQMA
jgi:hypothetical protein